MNTDNMALSGETIDYGPCAFMDAYDPRPVFSSIDQDGRYAYGNQPAIAQWNLARLAEAMLPLFDADQERAIELATRDHRAVRGAVSASLAGRHAGEAGTLHRGGRGRRLADALLSWMHETRADFTNTFRRLRAARSAEAADGRRHRLSPAGASAGARAGPRQPQTADEATALMRRSNPAVIPRNHRVEEALTSPRSAAISCR